MRDRRLLVSAWLLFPAALLLATCRRAQDEYPVAALASTPESEQELSAILLEWGRDPKARAALRPRLGALVARLAKSGDGLEPLARAYLAIAWLDEGVPAAAEATARPLLEGPAGVPADLGALVKGAAARRLGRSAEALTLLRPLIGKIIDPFAQPLLYEELVQACLDEGRWEDAIVYAEGWLRSAPAGEQKATRDAVARVLSRLPSKVAADIWEQNRAAPPNLRYSPDLLSILQDKIVDGESASLDAGSLPDAAVDASKDPKVVASPDAAIAPADLGPARFDPRAVAFLVPSSAPGYGSASVALTRAAAVVLEPSLTSTFSKGAGSPDAGSPSGVASEKHRLGVLDTGGTAEGVAKAFELAEKQGAGVIVGGFSPAEANALAVLAQQRRVPTILLRPPSAPPALGVGEKRRYIVLGPSLESEQQAALAAAITPFARVEPSTNATVPKDPDARCDAQPKVAGGFAFPIERWRELKIRSVIVLGDDRCAQRVVDELNPKAGAPWRPTVVLGLGALAQAYSGAGVPRVVTGAGLVPALDDAPLLLRLLWKDQGQPVGFYAGLGHDAAALALAALPGDLLATADPVQLQAARNTTLARLSSATATLWTTAEHGPGANGTIGRVFSVRPLSADKAGLAPGWLAKP